ncbi:MAG: hypothetical protein A3C30_03865 [Candidatus Levybacteria bacterium RIFCSPHIGHO2_02_FULL_40_18]|nr:MAG: hypothetical protein A2869_00485 [Candidatus Levybacteria bacterium RIFCSPHIGHO2_01_FULL_40_58]OGH26222.1 MAG: hypothetical protein A3C30_03865 [Candidatus Levybacteria bacterium RIFCSPHIGHO2_02_FULL_40_18]OGH31474.1 MAG: hypothetical protein A3E43_02905 [Candidatus Levybacteria bacterium RIFCSPHIGHO2_12_FULL_40_31]OGH40114.1 MAG: hypothetical protein A2894_04225 [Candidatus Levybacteria bacterium RIFCSPLOWO2_01_FULL_40_64]OGH49067.1 MAG: hypothetical protein A3I54_00650 [Candidatus Lev
MRYLSLKVPGSGGGQVDIEAPPGIPTGPQFTIGNIASFFIQLALIIGIFLSLFYIVYGGFYWLQASGDKQKWDKARRIVIYAIFGLIVMSLALVFVNLVAGAFGVKTVVNP